MRPKIDLLAQWRILALLERVQLNRKQFVTAELCGGPTDLFRPTVRHLRSNRTKVAATEHPELLVASFYGQFPPIQMPLSRAPGQVVWALRANGDVRRGGLQLEHINTRPTQCEL